MFVGSHKLLMGKSHFSSNKLLVLCLQCLYIYLLLYNTCFRSQARSKFISSILLGILMDFGKTKIRFKYYLMIISNSQSYKHRQFKLKTRLSKKEDFQNVNIINETHDIHQCQLMRFSIVHLFLPNNPES
jgi:hypothetical protein